MPRMGDRTVAGRPALLAAAAALLKLPMPRWNTWGKALVTIMGFHVGLQRCKTEKVGGMVYKWEMCHELFTRRACESASGNSKQDASKAELKC